MLTFDPSTAPKIKNRVQYNDWPHLLEARAIVGASLSEPHIDELNVRNLYIIIIIIIIIMVRTSPARRYRDCTGVRDIFQHDLEAA